MTTSNIADASEPKVKKVNIAFLPDGTPDPDSIPQGWTVTSLGYQAGYSVSHDGVDPDGGPTGPGCAFQVSKASDLAVAIQHKGKIPE